MPHEHHKDKHPVEAADKPLVPPHVNPVEDGPKTSTPVEAINPSIPGDLNLGRMVRVAARSRIVTGCLLDHDPQRPGCYKGEFRTTLTLTTEEVNENHGVISFVLDGLSHYDKGASRVAGGLERDFQFVFCGEDETDIARVQTENSNAKAGSVSSGPILTDDNVSKGN